MFEKYQHLERYGTTETDGIEFGTTYVFPKLDGTNGSIWLNEHGEIKAGSRNRELSLEQDNAGFYKWVLEQSNIKEFLTKYPSAKLYGEWLVKHTIKTYKDEAWHKFYVFDVIEGCDYMMYEDYRPLLEQYNIDYIPPIAKVNNGIKDTYEKLLEKNTYLIKDGMGIGEGIVIKNYDYTNKYGRKTWAKIVANEFKDNKLKQWETPEIKPINEIENQIVEKYCTEAFIEKEYQKLCNANDGWSSKMISRLIETLNHEFIKEEIYNVVKEFKSPVIDFKKLRQYVTNKTKQVKKDLF